MCWIPLSTMNTGCNIDIPLYRKLWELDAPIRKRYPQYFSNGLEGLGVGFVPPADIAHGGYYCTPVNTVAFAWTGGGDHYSFLVFDGSVDDTSPVVLTAPSNSLDENRIIAASLRDFLSLGLCRGFSSLEQFAYDPDVAIRIYSDRQRLPTDDPLYDGWFVPSAREKEIASFVQTALNLLPKAPNQNEFAELQARFVPMLKMSREYLDEL